MKKSNEQGKSKGIILFAFNSGSTDYVKIAERTASLMRRNLELPITLVTDTAVELTMFDDIKVIDNDFVNFKKDSHDKTWKNGYRYLAYDLSPYDVTLLLDVDYVVLDDSLLKLMDLDIDVLMPHRNQMINERENNNFKMGPFSLDYYWATVVVFQKTKRAQMFFDLVKRIQDNYQYYTLLYSMASDNFRNDHAFTIADNVLDGYVTYGKNTVPGTMLTIDKEVKSLELRDTQIIVRQDRAHVIPRMDLHIMDKDYLLSDDFDNFVQEACQ
jgi:hypothetical protein